MEVWRVKEGRAGVAWGCAVGRQLRHIWPIDVSLGRKSRQFRYVYTPMASTRL